MTDKVIDLVKKRAAAYDTFKVLADKDTLTEPEQADYACKKRAVEDIDGQITRARESQTLAAAGAQSVEGQDFVVVGDQDPYTSDAVAKARGLGTNKGLRAIAALKMFSAGGGSLRNAMELSAAKFGENHPITRSFAPDPRTRALITAVGASGGYIVPPDYVNEIIDLLRPVAVVRSSGPRVLPMPRGTMTLPGQASAATASYGTETAAIASSQQSLNEIVASFKKLTALVPVSNDMMRYADPAVDAFVRDDLVKVLALREDLAFLLGDGTSSTPRGFLSFANGWVQQQGGTPGSWSQSADSTFAVNAADPANTTGGNFITSNSAYTQATVAAELGGAANRLDTANVPEMKRMWFMHPRIFNYLYNLLNSLGLYVYRDELDEGKLIGYPFKKTTQIPTNYWDAAGSNKDLSFIFLAEMDEAMILDSMQLELMVSREGTYVDGSGNTVSAMQSDQTIIRAIAEHDFQLRHMQSVSIIQGVRWAPTIV